MDTNSKHWFLCEHISLIWEFCSTLRKIYLTCRACIFFFCKIQSSSHPVGFHQWFLMFVKTNDLYISSCFFFAITSSKFKFSWRWSYSIQEFYEEKYFLRYKNTHTRAICFYICMLLQKNLFKFTLPWLQKKQRSTLWPVKSESVHTERHSVHLPVAVWTCEWKQNVQWVHGGRNVLQVNKYVLIVWLYAVHVFLLYIRRQFRQIDLIMVIDLLSEIRIINGTVNIFSKAHFQ